VVLASAAVGLMGTALQAAEGDFAAAVIATRPIAYYRLDSTDGKSQVGATQYKAQGGVTTDSPGALAGTANNNFAKFDGHDGYILTTQTGGVEATASLMAWVNLASLPSAENRFFYVVGESQNGNDLDLQFETDNILKFYTASGGRLAYTPVPTSLDGQWHMIVATVDTVSQTRAIYWDGKPVATDRGGGRAGKSGALSIGASTVFGGRWFKGGIEEVALWNRAIKAPEVAAIFAASKGIVASASATAMRTAAFPTTAKVAVEDSNGAVPLKREEQIAILFLGAIETIEGDCQYHAKHACTLEQMVAGPVAADGSHINRLKFDPRTDPNYTYTVGVNGLAWEAHATAKRPGLLGFYSVSRNFPQTTVTYSRSGTASVIDNELGGRSIEGDSFSVQ
jgi:hypothetical protein